MKPFNIFVPFIPGMSEISLKEIHDLEIKTDSDDRFGCTITGHWKYIFLLNDYVRTINRVYVRLLEAEVLSFSELYNKIDFYDLAPYLWSKNLCVRVNSFKSKIFHERAIEDLFYKAIRNKYPDYKFEISSSPDQDDTQLFLLNLNKDVMTLSVDTSGPALYKRSYLKYRGEAPLRENIAAAMYKIIKKEAYQTIIDPFCGSGTIPIEFLINEVNAPISMFRRYSYQHWKSYDKEYHNKFGEIFLTDSKIRYELSDIDQECVNISRANFSRLKIKADFLIEQRDFLKLDFRKSRNKTAIVCNPPWGKRLDQDDIGLIMNKLQEISRNIDVYCLIPEDNLKYLDKYQVIFRSNSAAIKIIYVKIKN
jgi:putative N6-adenine-specific DNA methylase